jgi:pimeloyl-ACP methyl ester carboxylesterase
VYRRGSLTDSINMRSSRKYWGFTVLVSIALITGNGVCASDYRYEKRLSDSIVDFLSAGEAVWLEAEQRQFLSIFSVAEAPRSPGAIVVLPGITDHADSAGLVRDLRTRFAARGWHAMSLQMPVHGPDRDLKDQLTLIAGSGARIEAAVAYLAARGIKNPVLVGHGLGCWMAVDYLTARQKPPVSALVMVGMPIFPENPLIAPQVATFKALQMPVMDIFGSHDFDSVIATAAIRGQWLMKNPFFRQVEIEGANHDFHNDSALLFNRIYGWVRKNSAKKAQ